MSLHRVCLHRLSVVLFVLGLLLAPGILSAQDRTITATITKVTDGDTVTATTSDGTSLKIRLADADSPEIPHGPVPGQPYGDEAHRWMLAHALGRQADVTILGTDQYRRVIACLRVQGRVLSHDLVAAGLAEVYRGRNRKDCAPGIEALEVAARSAGRGMWALGPAYESPKAFRQRMRRDQPAQ